MMEDMLLILLGMVLTLGAQVLSTSVADRRWWMVAVVLLAIIATTLGVLGVQ